MPFIYVEKAPFSEFSGPHKIVASSQGKNASNITIAATHSGWVLTDDHLMEGNNVNFTVTQKLNVV